MSEQALMLLQIQELDFAAIDLNLYLDTHPNDKKALHDYNCLTQKLRVLRNEYQRIYGPLVNFGFAPSQYPWRWINDPWPWEIE